LLDFFIVSIFIKVSVSVSVSDFYGLGLGLNLLVSVSVSVSVSSLQVSVSVLVSNCWVSTTTLAPGRIRTEFPEVEGEARHHYINLTPFLRTHSN
jgi:hypothetical protein